MLISTPTRSKEPVNSSAVKRGNFTIEAPDVPAPSDREDVLANVLRREFHCWPADQRGKFSKLHKPSLTICIENVCDYGQPALSGLSLMKDIENSSVAHPAQGLGAIIEPIVMKAVKERLPTSRNTTAF
jgi:hypothetical protein